MLNFNYYVNRFGKMSYMKQIQILIRQNETIKKQVKRLRKERLQLITLINQFIFSLYPELKNEKYDQIKQISKQKLPSEQQTHGWLLSCQQKYKNITLCQFVQAIQKKKTQIMNIRKSQVLDILKLQFQKSGIQNIESQMLSKRNQFRDENDPLNITEISQTIRNSTYQLLNKIHQLKQLKQMLQEQIEQHVRQQEFLRLSLNDSQLAIKKMQYKIDDLNTQIQALQSEIELQAIERDKIQKSQKRWKSRFDILQAEYYQMQQSHNEMISEVMSVGAKIIQKD